MITHTVTNPTGKLVVRITEQGSRFTSRLYVNHGETATLLVKKATTLAGALRQADKLMACHVA